VTDVNQQNLMGRVTGIAAEAIYKLGAVPAMSVEPSVVSPRAVILRVPATPPAIATVVVEALADCGYDVTVLSATDVVGTTRLLVTYLGPAATTHPGHEFTVSVRMRTAGSSPYGHSTTDLVPQTVRALSLPEALRAAAALPLGAWFSDDYASDGPAS